MKKIEIDCKKAEKMIPGFIKGKLTDSDTTVLLDHVETCESCREELTIQYFISEGLDSIDENGDYDLLNGFNRKILNLIFLIFWKAQIFSIFPIFKLFCFFIFIYFR